MAPLGKIYTYPNNYRVQRALAIAALNGVELEIVPDFQMGMTNKTPEFLAKFPLGKVPAFESADGTFRLTESQAIARYVAESGPKAEQLLGGSDPRGRALVEQWCCFAEQEIAPNTITPLLMTTAKLLPYDEARYQQCMAALERAVRCVEAAVAGAGAGAGTGPGANRFLVGDRLTLADISIVSVLQLASKLFYDEEMRRQTPGVVAYMRSMLEVPELKQAFGELQLCETRLKGGQ